MTNKDKLLNELARLAVKVGVNVQTNQMVVINSPLHASPLTRKIVENAYLAGASQVVVNWSDDVVNKLYFLHASDEALTEVPEHSIQRL